MQFSTLYTDVQNRFRRLTAKQLDKTTAKEYVNLAYQEFARLSKAVVKSGQVFDMTANTSIHTNPSDCIEIIRAEMDGIPVAIRSTHWMDVNRGNGWRMVRTTSRVIEIVPDAEKSSQFRIYPMLRAVQSYTRADISFETATALGESYDKIKSVAGDFDTAGFEAGNVITTSSTTNPGPYRVQAVGTLYIQLQEDDVLTAEAASSFTIKRPLLLDYAYWPTDMSSDSDTPDFAQEFHKALFYYGTAEALQNEPIELTETLSRQVARYESKFADYVSDAKVQARRGYMEKTDLTPSSGYYFA
jgi:hypothetical protein